jgi:cysteine desulfurase/selenocysteine lyase
VPSGDTALVTPPKILRIAQDKAALRALFPVTRNLTYLNHAALGPLSTPASEAMRKQAEDQRDYGALHWREWYAEYDLARESAARLIGAEPGEIAFLKNTSEGLSFVAEGFRWERGDNVVTTGLEFPSNVIPWKKLERRGVECRTAARPEQIEELIDDRTRIVTVSSVAFHTGERVDIETLGAICKRRNVLLCVDAIQSLGMIPMDVRRANVAFLAADCHKWLCGPEGTTIFYVAAEHLERLDVLEHGWTNIERHGKFIGCGTELLPDSRRFEAGSANTNGIYGFRAAVDLLLEIGVEEIEREVVRLASRLADGLEGIGWSVSSPRPIASGIIGATPPNVEKRSLLWWHRKLEEQGIVCAPREAMLRFSPHVYNTDEEVDAVSRALEAIAAAGPS